MNEHIRNGHINVKHHWFYILVSMMTLSIVALICLAGYVYGSHREVAGYALGCQVERTRNPSQEYIESGLSFCWDAGNFYQVKPSRGGFRVVKDGGRP